MTKLPLIFKDGHLFIRNDGALWLFDTGAPSTFGISKDLILAEKRFPVSDNYMGLSAATLSQFTGVGCQGLLGTDVFGAFDHILDVPSGSLTVSTGDLAHAGQDLEFSEFMGIPTLTARIAGQNYCMFFDTRAQISYFQEDSITNFPEAGSVTDFYPGVGQFETDTHQVPVSFGEISVTLRCGTLPGLLGATLMMAGTSGIVGNQLCLDRVIGYFPRKGVLSL